MSGACVPYFWLTREMITQSGRAQPDAKEFTKREIVSGKLVAPVFFYDFFGGEEQQQCYVDFFFLLLTISTWGRPKL